MSRHYPPKLPASVRLIPLARAAERLAVSVQTFERCFLGSVFTEYRVRCHGHRKVFGDELDVFLSYSDEERAAAAVVNYRHQLGRIV